jgi:DNA-binding NarL/FixJ family response regulator
MHTRLIIADDNEVFRRGVLDLLHAKGNGLTILGSATNGKETLELVKVQQPDVILMDVDMPVMNGIEATKNILDFFPDIKIIGWSMSAERWVVREMVAAGVKGYLLKDTSLEELIYAIKIVANGKCYYNSEVRHYIEI